MKVLSANNQNMERARGWPPVAKLCESSELNF
jgi:hypothetical protein